MALFVSISAPLQLGAILHDCAVRSGAILHDGAVRTPYTFNGQLKASCHGRMDFTQCLSELVDTKAFIKAINEMETGSYKV